MPTDIRIIRTQDFIRAKPDGVLDLATSRDLLKDLAIESQKAGKYLLLVDTRGANVHLSRLDNVELGTAVAAEPALAGKKIALLVAPEEQVDAVYFEAVTRSRGAYLRAFSEFESAIAWLIMRELP
jgi:hypothetical protein